VEGFQRLQEEIVRSLREIGDWSRHPSNPVQDFKPHDAFVLQSDFAKVQKTLRQKEELLAAAQQQLREKEEQLKQAAPKSELAALQKEAANRQAEMAAAQKQLREKDANLEQAAKRAAALQNELAQKRAEVLALQKEIQLLRQPPPPKAAPPKKLFRAQPLDGLSVDAVTKMLKEKNFFDSGYNKQGKGLPHQYEKIERKGEALVIDHAAGLTWQQSGSPNSMTYADAEKYARDLNSKKFAGYNDWRLPTLEEAMSLMEPKERDGLFLDPVFDRKQLWIWTADKADSAGVAWVAYFFIGGCNLSHVASDGFVRVVR
jgi:DNA repair exonuclease SbcCD ATPase subunit